MDSDPALVLSQLNPRGLKLCDVEVGRRFHFYLRRPPGRSQDYREEIEGFGGFTWSGGVPVRPRTIANETIDEVTPKSGGSYFV